MSKSTSNQSKVATLPHLIQTTGNHLSHTDRHAVSLWKLIQAAKQYLPAKIYEDLVFNFEHMSTHLHGGIEHVQKLVDHVKDNYPAEGKELVALEQTVPRSDEKTRIIKKMAKVGQNQ